MDQLLEGFPVLAADNINPYLQLQSTCSKCLYSTSVYMMYDVFGFVILNIIYTVPYIKSKMLLQIGFICFVIRL